MQANIEGPSHRQVSNTDVRQCIQSAGCQQGTRQGKAHIQNLRAHKLLNARHLSFPCPLLVSSATNGPHLLEGAFTVGGHGDGTPAQADALTTGRCGNDVAVAGAAAAIVGVPRLSCLREGCCVVYGLQWKCRGARRLGEVQGRTAVGGNRRGAWPLCGRCRASCSIRSCPQNRS